MNNADANAPEGRAPIVRILRAIAPWMALATIMRTLGVVSLPTGAPLLYAAELPLFIAFLTTSQLCIAFTGGSVAAIEIGVLRRLALGKDILWRVFLVGLTVHYLAVAAGLRFVYKVPVSYGFDGLAFNRFQDFLLPWSLVIGLLTFLMVVDVCRGRSPSLYGAAGLFADHWRALCLALLLLVPSLAIMNAIQLAIGPAIRSAIDVFGSTALTAAVTTIYLFAFACIRLVGAVVVFTLALRWSWPGSHTADVPGSGR